MQVDQGAEAPIDQQEVQNELQPGACSKGGVIITLRHDLIKLHLFATWCPHAEAEDSYGYLIKMLRPSLSRILFPPSKIKSVSTLVIESNC